MKKTLAKTLRSALSLALALVLVLGTVGTAFAAPAVDENKIEAAMGKLVELLQNYGPDVVAEAKEYVNTNGYPEAVKAYAADLRAAVAEFVNEYGMLKAKLETVLAKVEAKAEALKDLEITLADIDAKVAELKEAVASVEDLAAAAQDALTKENAEAALDAIVEKYVQAREALFDAMADVEITVAKLGDLLINLNTLAEEICAATEELAEDEEVKAIVAELKDRLAPAMAKVEAKLAQLKAAAIKAYKAATTADYVITYGSNYVAIGDDTAAAENSYVDLLNAELGLLVDADKSMTGYTMIQDVVLDAEKIADADLITLGFSAANFVSTATDAVVGASNVDWAAYLPEEAVAAIELALDEAAKYIEAMGVGAAAAEGFLAAAECIAYNALVYAYELPKTVAEIRAINPDAVLVVVGLDNPMEETSITLGELTIPMDLLTDAIVETTNVLTLAYAILAGNCTFVAAPEAANDAEGINLNVDNLANTLLREMETFLPNAEGQAYIQEQIYNALNVSYNYLWGDANLDGTVDYIDAMIVLQHHVKLPVAGDFIYMPVCDVNGVDGVDYVDAMFILQHHVKLIDKFPVEE